MSTWWPQNWKWKEVFIVKKKKWAKAQPLTVPAV